MTYVSCFSANQMIYSGIKTEEAEEERNEVSAKAMIIHTEEGGSSWKPANL